jgi:uncharacterized protein (TIGR04222 family)
MFPFNLPGPEFLAFYVVFAIAVIAAFYAGRSRYEAGPLPPAELKDPLLFACLRGGPKEVVRVATLGLIDRGLLRTADRTVTRAPEAVPSLVRRRIDKEVLGYFAQPADVDAVLQRPSVLRVAEEEYEDQLRRFGLVPDEGMLWMRFLFWIATLAALLAVGVTKLVVAYRTGHGNVLFLVVLMAIAVFVATKIRSPYRSAVGSSYLANIRSMFEDLRERASSIRPGSGSRELLWLTALFGVASLPATAFPFIRHLWPAPSPTSSSSGGSSCGSSGSGCGGGGGGGCGGCGS